MCQDMKYTRAKYPLAELLPGLIQLLEVILHLSLTDIY